VIHVPTIFRSSCVHVSVGYASPELDTFSLNGQGAQSAVGQGGRRKRGVP
jgi:hypothetical protein